MKTSLLDFLDLLTFAKIKLMKFNNAYCVIMAGGVGSRFWPLSRNTTPKQFLDILGNKKTLIQHTYDRFRKIFSPQQIFIITNVDYEDLVKTQIPEIDSSQILLEPIRRNTAACIAYVSYKIYKQNPSATIVVAPSDHIILNEDDFLNIINEAVTETSGKNILMTLGIRPTRPDTGYGYIQYSEKTLENKKNNIEDSYMFTNPFIKKVKTFTEKPNYELAVQFLESGDFLWNSGIFIWTAKAIVEALQTHARDIALLFESKLSALNTINESSAIQEIYPECRNISIDYAVMEKAQNVYVYISDFGWSDLGTWGSLHDYRSKDINNNVTTGVVMLYETTNSIIHLTDIKLAVIQGLDDYIIVQKDGILLICKKSDEQKIRHFVNDIMIEKGEEFV